MKPLIPDARPVEELAQHLDLYDPQHSGRVWEIFDYARQSCPVIKTDADSGYFIVTRYEDLRTVLQDAETYSSAEAGLRGTPIPMPPLTEDPPNHIEFRRALNPYLTRTFLAKYEDDIRQCARDLLDTLVPLGRFEFMTDFAVPFTSGNLAKVILDDHDEERLQLAIQLATDISSHGRDEAFFELAALAGELLTERQALGGDRDDIIGAINAATIHGRPMTTEERVGATTILFTGGLDTTKAALGNIMKHVAEDPTIEGRLRDPEWMKRDLDEFLRLESPIAFMARTVTRETELDGCPLRPGDRVAVHYAGANRDPSRFEEPTELDFDRERNPHAAFGLGPHRCIGLHFARMQIEIGFEELFARITNVRIPAGEIVQSATGVVQSHEYLPIEFDAVGK